ncbi:YjzD family protein [Companilactobacillus sp. DQM5]|uniref:YjzD family protein n=1 Tax=Companilactobacillus sp. DQM5 TaxID=3463359 RepID=UPI004058F3AF
MKYIMVLFWSAVLGQVAGFIGSALTNAEFDSMKSLIISLIFGLIIAIIPPILDSSSPKPSQKK